MRDNPQTILEKHCPVFGALFLDKSNKAQMGMFTGIIAAMEEHAQQYKELEQAIRDKWVQSCLDRDELDEKYKQAISEVKRLKKEMLRRADQDDDVNDGKNARHEHSGGKGGWSV